MRPKERPALGRETRNTSQRPRYQPLSDSVAGGCAARNDEQSLSSGGSPICAGYGGDRFRQSGGGGAAHARGAEPGRGGHQLGYGRILASVSVRATEFAPFFFLFLLLLTVFDFFFSVWLALFLSKQITRPVEALADAMNEIAKGGYERRVTAIATSEMGDLVRSFNHMAADLKPAAIWRETPRRN